MLVDYRSLQRDLSNESSRARSWFFDAVNHFGTCSLDMTLEDYRRLPEF
jgi:hypothetical protein